jgi:hypothetical protein
MTQTFGMPAAPAVDQFSLAGAGPMAGKTLSMTASSELMHNQLPGSPVEPNTDIVAVQDKDGNPMLFSIGSDKKLRLIQVDSGSPTGFSEIDLGAGFGNSGGAAAFDASQDAGGRITVVVAMLRNQGPGTDLFVAAMLSNDPAQTDWAKFSMLARQVQGIDPDFSGRRVRMGTSDDGAAPYVTVVGALGAQQVYYQLLDYGKPATRLEFPENVPTDPNALLDMSIGYAFGQRGVWYLYKSGEGETLECTTLASSDQGALTYDFSPGYKSIPSTLRYNCVATPTGSNTDAFSISSDVYVGTDDGIYLFRNAHSAAPECVTDQVKDVHQLIVVQDASSIAVWAMCSPNRLYYIHGTKGAAYTWNQPILFSEAVVHMVPLRVRTRSTNEIFVVNSDLGVTHHWQDPVSTLWQQRAIRAPNSAFLLNVPSFTSRVTLRDPNGNPLGGVPLRITSSEWHWATANGLVYSLDHDTPAQVTTDSQGSVTIISLATDIAAPIYHLECEQFDKIVNLYPNGKILAGLQRIEAGSDLRNARTATGAPVVDPALDSDTLDGVVANLGQLTGAAGGAIAGVRPPGTQFVSLDEAKHTGALATANLPDNFFVGMQLCGGVWQAHRAPAPVMALAPMPAAMALGGIVDDFGSFVGDVLHWLENAFVDGIKQISKGVTYLKDGVSFVIHKVEEGLMFVLDLAGKAFRIVLKTLGAVLKALNWVLKLVGIDLAKILSWLGLLFGWDEIWKAHKILASVMRSGLDCAAKVSTGQLEQWRAQVRADLAGVSDKLRTLVLPAGVATTPIQHAGTAPDGGTDSGAHTPQAGFTHYQIAHGGMLSGGRAADVAGAPGLASFGDFLSTVVEPAIEKVAEDLAKLAGDIYRLFADPANTLQNLASLLCDTVDLVFDVLATIIDGALALVEGVIGTLASALTDKVGIPFLSDFYSFVTDLLGEEEDLTVINAVALLLAIPTVEICRIAGVKPFQGAEEVMGDPDLVSKVTGMAQPVAPMALAATQERSHPQVALASTSGGTVGISESYSAQYTAWGSVFGGFAGTAAAACSLLVTNNGQDPLIKQFNVREIATGFSLVRYGLTFPTKLPPYKTTAWCIGVVLTIVDYLCAAKPKVRGGLSVLRGSAGLILSLIQDGTAENQPHWLVYAADTSSNIGATALGVNLIRPNAYATAGGLFLGFSGAVFGLSYGLLNEEHIHAISNAGG